jgi:glycosyl transferase family 25
MSNPFDFFDHIYCINLDKRKDRWEEVQKEFESVGIADKVQRFSAIENTDGRVGVIQSNLALIKMAKENNWDNIMVFEDDVKFINNPLENLQLAIDQIGRTPWSMFYLGANTHEKLMKFKPNLIILKNAFAVHSVVYNKVGFNKFINKFEGLNAIKNFDDILDVWLAKEVQAKHTVLMVNPIITTQRESYSDIEKKVVNYSFIEERFNKYIQ